MKHGGDITDAALNFGREQGDWLDLSTGIAPEPYPVPAISAGAWQKLPQLSQKNALIAAARAAYSAKNPAAIIAAPGTQILIQLLPLLRAKARVRILGPTYSEHAICWQRTALTVESVTSLDRLADADVAIITNPNNPDGRIVPPESIREFAARPAKNNSLTIIDEAFADLAPHVSVVPSAPQPGLIVLRSFGKFYGLAGARLGFAVGHTDDIDQLAEWLGPWAVPGPTAEVAITALADAAWAEAARRNYAQQAEALDGLLKQHGLEIIGGTSLFRLTRHDHAVHIHRALAEQGILTRVYAEQREWIRFGLPHPDAFPRLRDALEKAVAS